MDTLTIQDLRALFNAAPENVIVKFAVSSELYAQIKKVAVVQEERFPVMLQLSILENRFLPEGFIIGMDRFNNVVKIIKVTGVDHAERKEEENV